MNPEWRAYRTRTGQPGGAPLLLTCEHASFAWPPGADSAGIEDRWLRDHYGWDPGAEALLLRLASPLGAPSVCATFSRLFVDANRSPQQPSYVRSQIEGVTLRCNWDLSDAAMQARHAVHEAYHEAVARAAEAMLENHERFLILGMHSFTPQLENECRRHLEIGVLHDEENAAIAGRLAEAIEAQGLRCCLNQPYSGLGGLVYAAARHGRPRRQPYLVLEARNDLIHESGPEQDRIGAALLGALRAFLKSEFGIKDQL